MKNKYDNILPKDACDEVIIKHFTFCQYKTIMNNMENRIVDCSEYSNDKLTMCYF